MAGEGSAGGAGRARGLRLAAACGALLARGSYGSVVGHSGGLADMSVLVQGRRSALAPGKPHDITEYFLGLPNEASTVEQPVMALPDGGKLPMVGIGTGAIISEPGTRAVLQFMLKGARHVDTGELYQNHKMVGAAVREAVNRGVPREEIFVTTKIPGQMFGRNSTKLWVKKALQELGLDYLDVVMLAAPAPETPRGHTTPFSMMRLKCGSGPNCRKEAWQALEECKAAGMIKNIGVSNFGVRQMQELIALNGTVPAINQLEYHPWAKEPNRRAVEFCHQHGIVVTAFSPLGSRWNAVPFLKDQNVKDVAKAHDKSPAQVMLRWYIQSNVTTVVQTTNQYHMDEDMNVFDFELTPEEMQAIGSDKEQYTICPYHEPDADA